jgi:predicted DsbA family dithiol-disulfide isomerase
MAEFQSSPILIDYYSDLLCIWAWIAQPRLDEMRSQYGEQLTIRHRYVDIFGDSHRKITRQWGGEKGYENFSDHVLAAGEKFEHCNLHPDIWRRVRPVSSMQAQVFVKAVQLAAGSAAGERAALLARRAFFCDARDISRREVLFEIAEEAELDLTALRQVLGDGSAMAELSNDLRSAGEQGVKGSPTWVLNEGRQVLYGNVGYRILSANIEELLRYPRSEASWC